MIYIAIALACLLVIGPVMWMRPSPAQKRQTRLRLRARALGLEVRLTPMPQARRPRVRQEAPLQGVVYRLPVFDRRAVVAVEHRIVREQAAAPWETDSEQPLPTALQIALDKVAGAVPQDVAAIEIMPQGPAVYWLEKGDEETVVELFNHLQSLRAAMAV